ncbi:MAG: 5'-nucleotidase C-terminal domain-containing protein [Burkholderiaceae bacterium]
MDIRKIAGITMLLAMLGACSSSDDDSAVLPPAGEPLELTILHINDHHSHLDEESTSLTLATAAGQREEIDLPLGGFARVTSAFAELSQDVPNVLKIHAGDAITGDLYYNLTDGKADADLMNTVCFDTMTLGNHEFDDGDAGLKGFIDFLHSGDCRTEVLSANVRFGASSPLHEANAPGLVKPSVVIERGGQRIGLVGLTVASKTKNASRPDADTQFEDETQAAQEEIDRLRGEGIDKIIVQSHLGYSLERELVGRLSGVDVLVGGDSHTLLGPAQLADYGLTSGGDYPTRLADRDGKLVCVVQAWQYSYVVGELRVSFDANGDVTECDGTPHVLIGDDFRKNDLELTPADRDAVLSDIAAAGALRLTTPDPAAEAILAPYRQEKLDFGSTVVAQADSNLCLRRVPGTVLDPTRSTIAECNIDPHVINHGGDIQQIVAEAFLQQGKRFFDADLSIQNGGGVRVDVAPGDIDVSRIYTVLPFRNTLVQLNMTGAEIKAALEDALDGVVGRGNTGSYPYSGGLRWSADLSQPKGSRLSDLVLRGADGSHVPLDPLATYKVVTIDFLADGSDFYTTLGTITGDRRIDVGLDYAEAFLLYVDSLPGIVKILSKLPTDHYSTQQFVDVAAN